MSGVFPEIYLVRHGETAWTISGQHTGRSDIPLTERGEREAQQLRVRLQGLTFATVLTSPLQRARRTGELAGFADCVHADPESTYKIYAESFGGADHLRRILGDAQCIVDEALAVGAPRR